MYYSCYGPTWFFGCDIVLEFVFFIVSLLLAIFSFRMYKICNENKLKLFSLSFILISLSYLTQTVSNFILLTSHSMYTCNSFKTRDILLTDTVGIFSHLLLMSIGLLLLAFMTFEIRKKSLFFMLVAMNVISLFLARNVFVMFFWLTATYLVIISSHFIRNYIRVRQKHALIIALAFILFLIGNLDFAFSLKYPIFYAMAHVLQLFAYILILINFFYQVKKNVPRKDRKVKGLKR